MPRKKLEAEIENAPVADPVVVAPAAPRTHMWARPARTDEQTAEPIVHDYPHQLPRLLHKDGEHKRVDTPDACEAAFSDGWTLLPKAAE